MVCVVVVLSTRKLKYKKNYGGWGVHDNLCIHRMHTILWHTYYILPSLDRQYACLHVGQLGNSFCGWITLILHTMMCNSICSSSISHHLQSICPTVQPRRPLYGLYPSLLILS